MINLDAYKCKNCKRGYKMNNSFLSGGVCLKCIRKALATRAKQAGASSSVKSKGSQVDQKNQKTPSSRASVQELQIDKKQKASKSMSELVEEVKHNSMFN